MRSLAESLCGLQPVKPLGFVRLSGLEHQGGEPLEGLGVSGVVANQQLQFTLLGLSIPLAFRQPGPQRVEVRLRQSAGPGWWAAAFQKPATSSVGQGKVQRCACQTAGSSGRRARTGSASEQHSANRPVSEGVPRSAQPDAVILAVGLSQCSAP